MNKVTQEFVQSFDGDITKLEQKINKVGSLVDEINKKASNVKFDVGVSDINKTTESLKNLDKAYGSFIKKLKDDNSIAKISKNAETLNKSLIPLIDNLTKLNKEFNNSLGSRNFLSNIDNINKKLDELNKKINEHSVALGKTGKPHQDFNNFLGVGNGFLGSMFHSIQKLLPFLSALFVIDGVQQFFSELYRVNKEFELFELKTRSALKGSKALTDEYYKIIKRIDIKSIFDIEELETGLSKLLQRGTVLTEKELQSLANTAAAVGTRGAQSFNQIVEALLDAQVGQYRRLEELGIGVDAKGEKLKLTFANITTEIEKSVPAITEYILGVEKMNGAYQLAEEAGNTLEGKLSSLKSRFDDILLILGRSGSNAFFGWILSGLDTVLSKVAVVLTYWQMLNQAAGVFGDNPMEQQSKNDRNVAKRIASERSKSGQFKGSQNEIYSDVLSEIETNRLARKKYVDSFNKTLKDDGRINTSDLLKNTKKYESILNEMNKYISVSRQFNDVSSSDYGKLVKYQLQLQSELNYAKTKNDESKKKTSEEALKKADLERKNNEVEDRVSNEKLRAIAEKTKLELDLSLQKEKEKLRFLKEGSDEYLRLKETIDLKEIEMERNQTREIIRENLRKSSIRIEYDKKNNAKIVYDNPTEAEVDAEFSKYKELFTLRSLAVQNMTNDAIQNNNQKIVEERKSLYEKLFEATLASTDREVKAIITKYNQIEKVIERLLYTTKDLGEFLFLSVQQAQIKTLQELEIGMQRMKSRQDVLVEKAKESIVRQPNESTRSYNTRVGNAGIQQQIFNAENLLIDFQLRASLKKDAGKDVTQTAQYKEIVSDLQKEIAILKSKLNIDAEKIGNFNISDSLILKIFGIDKNNPNASTLLSDLKSALNSAYQYYQDYVSNLISLEKSKEDIFDKNIDRLKSRLEKELELKRNGLANNATMIESDIKKQEELKRRSIERQIKLQKQQIIANTALKASELGVATYSAIKNAMQFGGPAGAIIAAANVFALFAMIASANAQVRSLSSQYEQFGFGGWVKGNSHANGGKNINVEGDEFVIRKQSATNNKAIVENLNKFSEPISTSNVHKLFKGTNVSFPSVGNEWKVTLSVIDEVRRDSERNYLVLSKEISSLRSSFEAVVKNTSRLPKKTYSQIGEGLISVQDEFGEMIIKDKNVQY